jgi:ABC-2 type transport system ATP-binding protein
MTNIIETHNLVKTFENFQALRGVSLNVPAGSIYGFVGPNGAGKTTTMRILITLTRPTSGEAFVAGHSVLKERREVRRAIGYMPDEFGVYEDLRVWEYLDFFAACYDIPENQRRRLVGDLLELVDLAHRRDDMVDKLSRGMKQRLSLARTLAHDPQVLILDEPASGLIRVLVWKSASCWANWRAWARRFSSRRTFWPMWRIFALTLASSRRAR